MPTVKFGNSSLIKLTKGLDPRLTHLLMHLNGKELDCDITVFETERTIEQQKKNIEKGVSWTLNSNHIPNEKGIVNAVDIVPYISGKGAVWDDELYSKIIPKIKDEAIMLGYGDIIDFGHYWKTKKDSNGKVISSKDSPHISIKKEYRL